MEKFKLAKGLVIAAALRIAYPLVLICFFIYIATSDFFRLSDKAPLLIGLTILWLIYGIYDFVTKSSFKVELSEDSIQVRAVKKKWAEIKSYEFKTGLGMSPAIILLCTDGSQLKIPGGLQNIAYVKNYIQNHVPTE